MKTNRERRRFSLKTQITAFIFGGILLILLILGILLTSMISSYQNKQNEKRMNDLSAYAETLGKNIAQLNNIVGTVYSTNEAFQGLNYYYSEAEKCDYVYSLLNLLQIQIKANSNLSGIFVFYDNLEQVLYYMNDNVSFEEKEQLKSSGKVILESADQNYSASVIATEKDLYYNLSLKKSSVALSGNIQLSQGLPDELEKTASYGILYEGVYYISAGERIELTEEECDSLLPGRNKLGNAVVYMQKLGATNMAVLEVLPLTPWLYVNILHIILAAASLGFICLSVKIYHFVVEELTKPLEDMTNALRQIQAGVWEVNFTSENRVEEIERVRQTVKVMLKKIEEYKIRTYEEQLEKQKTQLQYLQLQLAPHFYTNCLKNAYYMLMLKEYENVEKFLLCLSTHFRYLLQKDATMVSVQTERDFVLNYINLQKLMTSKQIICDIAVDEEALQQEVPILTLQTFVENSIKYARDMENRDLVIHIRVRYRRTEEGDYLDISVKDNGSGYSKEILEMLNQKEPSEEQRFGVGVINLQSRARLYYGEGANWYFYNLSGAFSEMVLPVKRGKMHEYITRG